MFTKKGMAGLAGVLSCTLLAGVVSAQEERDQTRDRPEARRDQESRRGEMPRGLERLNINQEQKEQIHEINQKFEQRFETAWNRFNKLHLKTVATEAAFLAAIEDRLDETQKEKFRDIRERQQSPGTEGRGLSAGRDDAGQPERRTTLKPNPEEADSQDNPQNPQGTRRSQERTARGGQPQALILYEVTITGPAELMKELGLTAQQQQQCDELCQTYKAAMKNEWRQLHGAHRQLVQLEAQKLREIEEVLSKDQLKQLHQGRERPPRDAQSGDAPPPRRDRERTRDREQPREREQPRDREQPREPSPNDT